MDRTVALLNDYIAVLCCGVYCHLLVVLVCVRNSSDLGSNYHIMDYQKSDGHHRFFLVGVCVVDDVFSLLTSLDEIR